MEAHENCTDDHLVLGHIQKANQLKSQKDKLKTNQNSLWMGTKNFVKDAVETDEANSHILEYIKFCFWKVSSNLFKVGTRITTFPG